MYYQCFMTLTGYAAVTGMKQSCNSAIQLHIHI